MMQNLCLLDHVYPHAYGGISQFDDNLLDSIDLLRKINIVNID